MCVELPPGPEAENKLRVADAYSYSCCRVGAPVIPAETTQNMMTSAVERRNICFFETPELYSVLLSASANGVRLLVLSG